MGTDFGSSPCKVHFVGSIGLDTVQEVFHTCGTMLGDRLERIPDGEPGGRRLWCSWQIPLLRATPFFKVANPGQGRAIFGALKLADGVRPEEVRFGELGYAREARASYQDFLEAKRNGEIAPQDQISGLDSDSFCMPLRAIRFRRLPNRRKSLHGSDAS
jgi:hypothetical protein